MSYDLMVFEPGVPPEGDRVAFIAWFSQVVRLRDGHLTSKPEIACPALQPWYREMVRMFPDIINSDHAIMDFPDGKRNADYRFAPHAIFARFDWDVSRKAYQQGLKLARKYGVGLFDAGGECASVWTVSPSGKFHIAHSGEASSRLDLETIRA